MDTRGKLGNVSDFDFLLEHSSERVIASVIYTMSQFRSQIALSFLLSLITHENEEIRSSSAQGIITILEVKGLNYLETYKGDAIIDEIINEYKDIYYSEDVE